MALAKRAAKRIAPKTLEKMREKRRKESENFVIQLEDKEFTIPNEKNFKTYYEKLEKNQKKDLQLKRNRVAQIERQREHLLSQPKAQNAYKDALLLEYRTKAKTQKTRNARIDATQTNTFKTEEGIIIDKKKHNELLKRNEVALNNARLAKERAEISRFLSIQEKSLNKNNMYYLADAHKKITNYLIKKYNSKKIDYNKLKEITKIIDYSVKSGIRQHNLLLRSKNPEYLDLHSKIISKCLLSFMKTQNHIALKENLNLINSVITKNERSLGLSLYELDRVIR